MKETVWQKRQRQSAELRAKVLRLLAQGMNQTQVGAVVGVSKQRVQQIAAKNQ